MQVKWGRASALALLNLGLALSAQASSVYYNFRIAATTDTGTFSGFGVGPSVNDQGKLAFTAQYPNGSSVIVWDPVRGSKDIAPGFLSSNRSFGNSAFINHNNEVAVWTRVLGANPVSEVRVFRGLLVNDSTAMVRAEPGLFPPGLISNGGYDALFQYPAINNSLALEDDTQGGNGNGVCDPGETCVSQVAFGAFRAATANNGPLQRLLGTVTRTPSSSADFGGFNEFTLNTSNAQPMMADDGSVVVRGNLPTNPILLFPYGLGAPKQIAGSSDGFTALGNAPAITPDAKIVAFAGNRGNGDGIFLSILLPSGNRRLVRIVGENTIVPKAELGYDANQNKLYFSSISLDSRVGIIYTPDVAGNANGSVVVSFVGTPNAASRTNPSTGRPWTFSAQQGLFTVRIDLNAPLMVNDDGDQVCVATVPGAVGGALALPAPVGDDLLVATRAADGSGAPKFFIAAGPNGICETPNDYRTDTLFTRTSPIPVVQLGDTFYSNGKSYVIASLSVNGPLAQANVDALNRGRAERIGDHRVSFWAQAMDGTQLIVWGEHLDSDQDGLLDHWETNGIDLTGNGHIDVDLPAMGADPFVRDLFLQMDFGVDRPAPANFGIRHVPAPTVLRNLSDFFANAPSPNPSIPPGIVLHVDAGAGSDPTGQSYSRNMRHGELIGGNTVAGPTGQTVDVLYKGPPGSVNFVNATALSMDEVKAAHFWNKESGGREFAFLYIVMADFHHAVDLNGNDANQAPFTGIATGGNINTLVDANSAYTTGVPGNSVLITSGTGAGQLRWISGALLHSITVKPAWTTAPDGTSHYMFFSTSSGEGHASFNNDDSFGPGKNLAITLAGFMDPPLLSITDASGATYKYMGNVAIEWKTLAHEIGHLLTLKHGGTNHHNYRANYISLMSYAYQLCPSGRAPKILYGNPAGAAPCPVVDYSGSMDLTFYDWGHINLGSAHNLVTVGNAMGDSPDVAPAPPETQSPLTLLTDYGPPDVQAPVVVMNSPANGASVTDGSGFSVTFTATDNVGVTEGKVTFDVNGDGVVDEKTEEFPAVAIGGNQYRALIPAVSGPNGARTVMAYAFDAAANPGVAAVTVNVGAVVQNVSVPNVVGLSQAAATAALQQAGLTVGNVTQANSPTVPAGSVISENPAANTSVAPGTAVTLVVSIGPANVAVPNVVGLSQAAATAALQQAGLTVGNVTQANSPTVPAGSVISENPAANTSVAPGTAVALVVSIGPVHVAGDLNGDGVVNCLDLSIVKAAFGKKTGQAGFNPVADLNGDGVVNIIDLSMEARLLPAGLACH